MKKIAQAAFRRLAGKPDDAPPDTVPAAGRIHEMCREGKAQEAEQLLLGSLRARPTPAAARMLGTVYAMQQRYDEAIEVLRGALDSESRHAGTANLIGVCCSLMDRHQEALRFYDAAIAADASLADAYANAGWSSSVLGRADAKKLFHDWLAICASERPEIGMRPGRGRLKLPGVTLCCVDCAYHDLAATALRVTLSQCEFGAALFLSDRDCGVADVRFVKIERIGSSAQYSNFLIHRLHEHIRTDHALIIQYDGFVLSPDAWDPRFLEYDYIGGAMRVGDGFVVGNGGFSLRSRKLLQALGDDAEIARYDAHRGPTLEDVAICSTFRPLLETRYGIRFAPPAVADRFSAEHFAPNPRSFGFHNLIHLVRLHQNRFELSDRREEGVRIVFRAQTELGMLTAQRELDLQARADVWSA